MTGQPTPDEVAATLPAMRLSRPVVTARTVAIDLLARAAQVDVAVAAAALDRAVTDATVVVVDLSEAVDLNLWVQGDIREPLYAHPEPIVTHRDVAAASAARRRLWADACEVVLADHDREVQAVYARLCRDAGVTP